MIPGRAAAVLLAACLLSGCAVRPEQTQIGDFFAACRLRDLTALARIGTVVFEPRERGTVTSFVIESVSPERAEAETVTKDVAIDAQVRLPDGGTATKSLLVRLQRPSNPREPDPSALYGGWIVTAVTDAPSSAVPPRS
jgi:hypothetical protein